MLHKRKYVLRIHMKDKNMLKKKSKRFVSKPNNKMHNNIFIPRNICHIPMRYYCIIFLKIEGSFYLISIASCQLEVNCFKKTF